MEGLDLPPGVDQQVVATPRLDTHLLTSGPEDGIPVLFVHGNASSSRFFEDTLAALARLSRYRALAPDLRGYGDSETKPLDATRGLRDFADACESQQIACEYAAQEGLGWEPLPPARRLPPPELRPDSGRRGPAELWARFDPAWEDLGKALEGISLPAVARAFGELAIIARDLSAAVAEADRQALPGVQHG